MVGNIENQDQMNFQEICWKRELKVFLLKTLQDDHN